METAPIFQNGKSQAVRIPKKYRFQGNKVFIQKVGDLVILSPYENPWRPMIESLSQFSSDFMTTRQQPAVQPRQEPFA